MKIHPIAQCYPALSESDFEQLKEDIRVNKQRVPIVLFEDQILDGVHRQRACEELGIVPTYERPSITDPFAYSISLNERRRSLTKNEVLIVGEKLAKLKHGSNRFERKDTNGDKVETTNVVSISQVTKQLGLSHNAFHRVRYAKSHSIPDVIAAMEAKNITITCACRIAHLPKREQAIALEQAVGGKRKAGRPKGSLKNNPKARKISIDPAPLDTRCDRLWHQMCSGWLDTFSTIDEKRAVFCYMMDAMTRAMQLINEVDTMEDLYVRTH